MRLWKKKEEAARAASAQVRCAERHPFGMLGQYVPLRTGELRLYRAVREAAPVVDAAIYKLIRLSGGVTARCRDRAAQAGLEDFLRTVRTGRAQRGINAFLDCYLDSLLTCGRAVGEIVPTRDGRDIAALLCARAEDVEIQEGTDALDFMLCGRGEDGQMRPLPYQSLLLFTPFNPEAEHPYGVSLLRSMPFLTELLMKVYNAMGQNWERCGNVRYAVVYKPGEGENERASAGERVEKLAQEWSSAMQSTRDGSVRDFVTVGNVEIRAIGADNQILDSETPVRQIMEQLIAKTGIPPFMLGLNWSSTERMSSQQADLLTSEITAIRRTLTPAVERICELWLRMHGYSGGVTAEWDDINLQDQVEEARAALFRQQARRLCLENDKMEREGGTL